MATIKFTMLFNWGTRAGFTETFYAAPEGGTALGVNTDQQATRMAQIRMNCMAAEVTLVGIRTSDTDVPKRVRFVNYTTSGNLGTATLTSPTAGPDPVTTALLTNLKAVSGADREYLQRGLPDGDVVGGIFTAGASGMAPYTRWFNFLKAGNSLIRDMVPGPTTGITTINGTTGAMTVTTPEIFAVGDLLHIKTRIVGQGCTINATKRVKTGGTGVCILRNWKKGDCAGGTVSPIGPAFSVIDNVYWLTPRWTRTRKTGRPFGQPRGRSSRQC